MKSRIAASLFVAIVLVGAPLAAYADCNGAASPASTDSTPSAAAGHLRTSADVGPHNGVFVEGPTVEARVTDIDIAQGLVTVEARGQTLSVLAPPDQLAGVDVGDVIRIALDD